MAKSSWFKKGSRGDGINNKKLTLSWKNTIPKEWRCRRLRQREVKGFPVSTVIIVPNTPNASLLNAFIQKEAQLTKLINV